MNLGILGGSFNPVHLGHLILAQEAKAALGLEKVLFIPCALPPHKSQEDLLDAAHRLKMVALAIEGDPSFEACDIEIRRGGVSYSVETLRALHQQMPSASFYFLIGSDALAGLSAWREIETLFRLCHFAVAERPKFPLGPLPPGLLRFPMPEVAIASQEIRQRLRENRSVRYLVPEAVRDYLERNHLYRWKVSPSKP